MASAKNLLLLVSAVCSSLLFLSPLPATAAVSELVNTVCNGAGIIDKKFCLDALSTPKAAGCNNPKDLMKVVMTQARDEATTVSSEISLSLPLQLTNPGATVALKKCLTTYKNLIQAFTLEVQEMEEDPLSASYDSKISGDTAAECDTALASANVDLLNITAGNARIKKYISISFEVANAGCNQRK